MDDYTEGNMPAGIEAGTLDYWKWRARQWQRRCQRAEREKGELISMLNGQRREAVERAEARKARRLGDIGGGTSGRPSSPYRR